MSIRENPKPIDAQEWIEKQVRRYGPLVGGDELRQFLGFRTADAFHKARSLGLIDLTMFTMHGRKGQFAFTDEACEFLLRQRAERSTRGAEEQEGGE